jgi:DNA ligase-1
VNNTSSTTEKYALLTKYPACHSILKRIYDPHLRHHVTAKTVKKYIDTHPQTSDSLPFRNLTDLLDALSSRTITGHAANEAVASFYKTFCTTQPIQDLFWRILDRNLKMGVSVKTIRNLQTSNNAHPAETKGKNQRISVALAIPFTTKTKHLDFRQDTWFASQKLDGIRCIVMARFNKKADKYDIEFYSRTGRPFTSLQKVRLDIEKRLNVLAIKQDFALDGEVCAYADDNARNENFITALKQIRRMNEEMENPVYQAFDMIPLDQFLATKGDQLWSKRQKQLKHFIGRAPLSHLKIVQQQKLLSMSQLEEMKANYIQSGWEGLIIRKDALYEGKRT